MYMSVATFLEICSYISPGTGQEKWMKTYGAKLSKLCFPDEWFETAEKLDFPGLPPHEEWFSELKNEMTLSEEAYRASQRIWQEKGMRTFKDLLRFYNNLDFEPFLEALGSIRHSYTGLRIDILKDAVPLPGVSMKYLLRGTPNKRDSLELYTPGEKGYEILKGAVVRGPSLVLCRKRESVRTSSKTRRCVQEFWPTTPTRCIQTQWRSLRNRRKRQGKSKSLLKFCRETDGLNSP